MPEEIDNLRQKQEKYIITNITRKCRQGHMNPNTFEDY